MSPRRPPHPSRWVSGEGSHRLCHGSARGGGRSGGTRSCSATEVPEEVVGREASTAVGDSGKQISRPNDGWEATPRPTLLLDHRRPPQKCRPSTPVASPTVASPRDAASPPRPCWRPSPERLPHLAATCRLLMPSPTSLPGPGRSLHTRSARVVPFLT
jgi:hypothetical protein